MAKELKELIIIHDINIPTVVKILMLKHGGALTSQTLGNQLHVLITQ